MKKTNNQYPARSMHDAVPCADKRVCRVNRRR